MNQLERQQAIIDKVESYFPLEEIPLDDEISATDVFLKLIKIRCHNWRADQLPKIGALNFSVTVPSMDALNMIFYPGEDSDAPIFLLFFLVTGRKIICHFNINLPFDDELYRQHWVTPLEQVLEKYPPFEMMERYPVWMQKYKLPCTVYGMFNKNRLDELTACLFDFLDVYLSRLSTTGRVSDPAKLSQVSAFHQQFKDDIRTQDKAQGMTAKFIGKDRARRIFYEVVT